MFKLLVILWMLTGHYKIGYGMKHINSATSGQSSMKKRPHIIILLADDLGWNEVSWNNPLFLTPNLEVRSSNI